MNIVLLHGWLRGNLGDACITYRLISFLKQKFPNCRLTLLTEPHGSWSLPAHFSQSLDRIVAWSCLDSPEDFLRDADAVIQVPGGGLQDPGDSRAPFMLRDAALARDRKIPHAFAGHSFHPSYDLEMLRGSFLLAREPASHDLLLSRRISSVLSADPAFLEPMPAVMQERKGTVVFLRFRHFTTITVNDHELITDGSRTPLQDSVTLASSDPLRDDDVLQPLSERYGLPYERCMELSHLLRVIGEAREVVTDRYHPAIFATMLGIPCTFVPRQGSLRDEGLLRFMRDHTPAQLGLLAESGFRALGSWLQDEMESASL